MPPQPGEWQWRAESDKSGTQSPQLRSRGISITQKHHSSSHTFPRRRLAARERGPEGNGPWPPGLSPGPALRPGPTLLFMIRRGGPPNPKTGQTATADPERPRGERAVLLRDGRAVALRVGLRRLGQPRPVLLAHSRGGGVLREARAARRARPVQRRRRRPQPPRPQRLPLPDGRVVALRGGFRRLGQPRLVPSARLRGN